MCHKSLSGTERLSPQTNKHCFENERISTPVNPTDIRTVRNTRLCREHPDNFTIHKKISSTQWSMYLVMACQILSKTIKKMTKKPTLKVKQRTINCVSQTKTINCGLLTVFRNFHLVHSTNLFSDTGQLNWWTIRSTHHCWEHPDNLRFTDKFPVY